MEEYYNLSNAAYETGNVPSADLASTEYKSVEGFNNHIKQTVCNAGYGTREGVIAAGISLIGDYIKATGKRLRYDQGGRQYFDGGDNSGIINEDFYLDCSSFAWWSLYNGGFKIPCWPYTGTQREWSNSNGYSKTPGPGVGQGGDYLVSSGHIILILGTYSDGYYCAEEAAWGTGAIISKRSFSGLGGYTLIDMTGYYNNSSSVREGGDSCGGSSHTSSSKTSSKSSNNCDPKDGKGIYSEADFEDAYNLTHSVPIAYSISDFESHLSGTDYKNLAGFNSFMKSNVEKAGYGTREGVVAAIMTLAYEYPKAAGYKLFYQFPNSYRNGQEGVTYDTYLDCRAFVQWAVYNGGYHASQLDYITSFTSWGQSNGLVKSDLSSGQPGDIFSTDGTGHIWIIIGRYDGGYYVAEEFGPSNGLVINKYSFENAQAGYAARLYDMSSYYHDSGNVRS